MRTSRSAPSTWTCERGSPRARSANALWKAMNTEYAGFEDYDARTSRDIAVFVLEPR